MSGTKTYLLNLLDKKRYTMNKEDYVLLKKRIRGVSTVIEADRCFKKILAY